jgi:hypothetical protein
MVEHGIKDIDKRFKQLKIDEGWDYPGDSWDFDEMFPDYDKDEGRTVEGIFLELVHRKRKKDNKPIDFYVIITEAEEIIAIRDFALIVTGLDNVKKGDGVRVTYKGLEKKKTGDGSYRNFQVGVKKFEPDPEPTPQTETNTLADNDDPEAVATIGLFNDIINSNFKTKGLTGDARSKEIIRLAEQDDDMDEQSVARVIKQLAADAKKAQNK